jgi:hypothetical protein
MLLLLQRCQLGAPDCIHTVQVFQQHLCCAIAGRGHSITRHQRQLGEHLRNL